MSLPWSDDPELSKEALISIRAIINTEDPLQRYRIALGRIEYFSAYLETDKHSKFSLVCSQAAQDPELFKQMEQKNGSSSC